MKILVTGAAGFVGKNLVENLKNVRDGKNKTRPDLIINDIYEYDRDNTIEDLDSFCSDCDFVFNLAGVNRPNDSAEFARENYGFADMLLNFLSKHKNKASVMFSSSIQASLAGRFGVSEYGLSKRDGEELFFQYAKDNGTDVYVYRFPNLVGKWCRPNYNSAIATFCNNIANDLPITVNDTTIELELLFIDDMIEEMLNMLEGHVHKAEYPVAGEVVDGITYDGLTPRETVDGRYCYVPTTHKATLGRIVELLLSFHDQPETLIIPTIPKDSLEKKLYSMYLSYLPKEKIVFEPKMHCDKRGSFTELLKTVNHGQVSVNISKPGVIKGQHWHNSKLEYFIVVAGHGLIQERKIGTNEVIEFEVDGEKIQVVQMLPGYTHNIINLSKTENLVTIMWANEIFDSSHSDTFYEIV